MKQAAIESIMRYGITFPSSRAYVSNFLFNELEMLLEEMYEAPIVLATSLSLGHHGAMPVVVDEKDAIILDQQVHSSVQDAARKLRSNGVYLDIVRHNQMEQLEQKVIELSGKYEKVWYMCDGVYSMYGDVAPLNQLIALADRYKNFFLYVDDAHGMSVFGKNGTGYVMEKVGLHPKMILSTGMAKAFGSVGGIFIIPDKELAIKVRNCAGPLIFSGQQATPLIAASIASAKIHLTQEISYMQNVLAEKIKFCHELLIEYNLPNISNPETPIFFIALGTIGLGFNMVKRMMIEGFYANIAAFPAVPEVNTGIRFTITLHLTFADIENFVKALARQFPLALLEEGRTVKDIKRAFNKIMDLNYIVEEVLSGLMTKNRHKNSSYHIFSTHTIEDILPATWNKVLGSRGTFTWEAMKQFETIFKDNELPEHNLSFLYYLVTDDQNQPVLATFFSIGLIKNDLLSPSTVSAKLEQKRQEDPYFQTAKAIFMGSVVTEGNHLYIDSSFKDWKEVLRTILDQVAEVQERQEIETLILRDFEETDNELNEFFLQQGFLKTSLPDTHVITDFNFSSKSEFISKFDKHRRQYLKQKVFNYEQYFEVKVIQNSTEIKHWYHLYRNVKENSYEINTFCLPEKFFEQIAMDKNWEIIELKLKPEFDLRKERNAVAVMFCLKTPYRYCPLYVGLDYIFLDYNIYPQILWQTVLRAQQLHLTKINLGFTASQNKKKFGAVAIPQVGFVQMKDNFNMALLGLITNERVLAEKSSK